MKTATKPDSVDAYIAAFPPNVQDRLNVVREAIRRVAPSARECISYNMPTFRLGDAVIHFAAFKGHIGVYPPVRDAQLDLRVLPYRGEKGNLKFPLNEPLPSDLIEDIAKALFGTGHA